MVNLEPILFVFINQNMIQPKLKLLNCDLQNIEMCIAIKVILINKVVLGEQKKRGRNLSIFSLRHVLQTTKYGYKYNQKRPWYFKLPCTHNELLIITVKLFLNFLALFSPPPTAAEWLNTGGYFILQLLPQTTFSPLPILNDVTAVASK